MNFRELNSVKGCICEENKVSYFTIGSISIWVFSIKTSILNTLIPPPPPLINKLGMYCDELHWECTFNDLGYSSINVKNMSSCDHVLILTSVCLNLTPCLSNRPYQDEHYYFLPPCLCDLTRPNVTSLVFASVCSLVRAASPSAGDLSAWFTSFLGVLNLAGSTRSPCLVTQTHNLAN